jgi:hypothetical protein
MNRVVAAQAVALGELAGKSRQSVVDADYAISEYRRRS